MKFFLSILMVLSYIGLSMRPSTPWVEYSLKKSYIIQKLCENRDRPVLKCDGKCYLSKRLKQAAGEQGPQPCSEQELIVPVHLIQNEGIQVAWADQDNPVLNPEQRAPDLYQVEPAVPPPRA